MFRITSIILLLSLLGNISASGQFLSSGKSAYPSFVDYQRSQPNPAAAWAKKEDTLRKQFRAKKLTWPARFIYVQARGTRRVT